MSNLDSYLRQQAAGNRLASSGSTSPYLTAEDEARIKKEEEEKIAKGRSKGNAFGTVVGGIAGAYFGNPMLGAQLGGAIGGEGGAMLSGGDLSAGGIANIAGGIAKAQSPSPDGAAPVGSALAAAQAGSSAPPSAVPSGESSGPLTPEQYRTRMGISSAPKPQPTPDDNTLAALVRAAYLSGGSFA